MIMCLKLAFCVCGLVIVGVCVCACMEVRGQHWYLSQSITSTLTFKICSLFSENAAPQLGRLVGEQTPGLLPICAPSVLVVQICSSLPGLSVGAVYLTSGSHLCVASCLLTELSHQLLTSYKCDRDRIVNVV